MRQRTGPVPSYWKNTAQHISERVVEYDPQPPFDAGSPDKAGFAIVELATAALGCSC